MIHLRAPGMAGADLQNLAMAITQSIGGQALVMVNGNVDAAHNADGVHLPERFGAEAIASARAALPPTAVIGRSVHSPEEAVESTGADYLFAGHLFATASHPDEEPLGAEKFRMIASAVSVPVIAIGGITEDNVGIAIDAGASGVAMLSAVSEASDPMRATRRIRESLDEAWIRRTDRRPMMEPEAATGTLRITVNGKDATVAVGWSVRDFLASKRMSDNMAIVERNGLIVPRTEYGSTLLAGGDVLEIVHAVGGG